MENTERQVAQMFDKIAGRYDFLNHLLSLNQDQNWRDHLIRALPRTSDGRLLDVATGTGDVLQMAMRKRKDYTSFVGVDISENMLDLAKKKCRGSDRVRFSTMSAESLVFPDASFDCLTIAFGLRNVIQKDVAIREFFRVLAPGGELLILEFFKPASGIRARGFKFYFHHILPWVGGLISDREAYRYLPTSVDAFYSKRELKALMEQEGFTIKRDRDFLFGACTLISATKPHN